MIYHRAHCHHRLEKEGRLRRNVPGDQFGLTNVMTRLPTKEIVAGYRRVLETLYDPEVFFDRCRENLRRWRAAKTPKSWPQLSELVAGLRSIRAQGIVGPYRRAYWSFMAWVVRHRPSLLPRALAQAASGHHYITYTREVVIPSLERTLASLEIPERSVVSAR